MRSQRNQKKEQDGGLVRGSYRSNPSSWPWKGERQTEAYHDLAYASGAVPPAQYFRGFAMAINKGRAPRQ
jgi:hypothetical protein